MSERFRNLVFLYYTHKSQSTLLNKIYQEVEIPVHHIKGEFGFSFWTCN